VDVQDEKITSFPSFQTKPLTSTFSNPLPQEPKKEHKIEEEFVSSVAVLEKEEEIKPTTFGMHEPKPVLNHGEIKRPVYEEDPGAVFNLETTVARYIPKEKEIKEIEPILTEMMVVPGGEYFRGSNEGARDERPRHMVMLSSFAIDKHP